jgi:hypothetical protein
MLFVSLLRLRLGISLPRIERNNINLVEDILLSFKRLIINYKTGNVRTERNIEEPSCNHRCSEKAIIVTYMEYVSVVLIISMQCNVKVKVSHNRPRWPKGFRVG